MSALRNRRGDSALGAELIVSSTQRGASFLEHRRVLAAICANIAVVCIAVAVGRTTARLKLGSEDLRITISALLFLAISSSVVLLLSGWRPSAAALAIERWCACAVTVGVYMSFLLWALVVTTSTSVAATTVGMIFAAAAVEEFIFRRLLPSQVARLLAKNGKDRPWLWFISLVLAQATFAACHVLSGAYVNVLSDSLRLFTAGLLYCVIMMLGGLRIGIPIHAALNLDLLASRPISPAPDARAVAIVMGIGLFTIWYRGRRPASPRRV